MPDTVFITGASGMMGQHLLQAICACDHVARVLVLTHHSPLPVDHPKIRQLKGDITLRGLGLEPACSEDIARRATHIIHGAAQTSFSSEPSTARGVNVGGTENLFRLAEGCRRLKTICYLSTVYVAGKQTGTIDENHRENTLGFVNAYEQSKYEAEQLVRSSRLPVSIVRLSTILGDSRDGAPPKLGGIHHALRFFFHSLAPFVPGTEESLVDLIAADYAAAAVVALTFDEFARGRTWHVCGAEDSLPLGRLLDLSLELFSRNRPAWRQRAIARPAIVRLQTFERFAETVEELGQATLGNVVRVIKHFAPQMAYPKIFSDCETRRVLESVNLRRPAIADFYPKVIAYLVSHNWQPALARSNGHE
ncbi:MAG TPA: SDR family oxidoreductase [Candidatus Angelobacter sp.]|nr:SDR family oxidoreductase [Candidatus Angelobacter sp.]